MASFFRSGNPALSDNVIENNRLTGQENLMTISGSVNKTFILFGLLLCTAIFSWYVSGHYPQYSQLLWAGGAMAGFITAMITIFKKQWAAITAPIYALFEGLFLGAISFFFNAMYPGIVVNAIALTIGVLFIMLFLYKTGVIKVTKGFMIGLLAATGSIALLYIVNFILSLTGLGSIGFIHDAGPIGIGFSAVVVIIAALNLVWDFHFFERGEQAGLPKYMEWYAAFGIMITLVWLYIEILRLLSKLKRR